MRRIIPLTALCLLALQPGCQKADPDFKPRGTVNLSHRTINEGLVHSYNLRAEDDAIIRQHTIYPYHFIANSAALNALGRREVFVLGQHYRNYPGPLNVHQGDAPGPMYQARVKTITDAMVAAGVPADRVVIADDLPGGSGLPSDQVVIVLDRMRSAKLSGASAPAAASASGSSMNDDSSGGNDTPAEPRTATPPQY